ncbi:MAG: hypothetical protein NTZ79_06370 [Proteobacteria bacterium]|nr:hypothetical protein [Pseudomonadota bacterium]
MSVKFYTRFVADLGTKGPSEYTGIVEIAGQDRLPSDPQRVALLIARDLDLEAEEVRVLQWSRLH